MSLRDRIPVEPIPPDRWGHLEQRIVAHAGDALARPAPRRWWPVVAAVGIAGAVAVVAVAARPPPRRDVAPLVVTAYAQGAHVELGDAVIDAEPGTRFEVTRPDGGVRIALASGAVSLEVAPRRDRPPLWVIAGEVSVRVVGTAFSVRRDPEVTVTVTHGVVEVDRAGAAVAVRAGQRWSTTAGVVAVAAAPAAGSGADRGIGAAATSSGAGLALAPVPVPDLELLGPRQAAVPPLAGGGPRLAPTGGAHAGTSRGGAARPAPAGAVTPAADLRAAIAAQPVAPAPRIAATSATDAIAAYQRELVTARGAAASAALWGLARTQWAQGRHADAVKSLDGYVRRFTSGAEADAVRWLRLRLLCARAFDDTCRAAAHTYAQSASDGPRRELAVRATQTR